MDRDFLNIVYRIAGPNDVMKEIDEQPDYTKVLNILNLQTKNSLKDLIESVKDEDEEQIIAMLEIIFGQFEEAFRYLGLRSFRLKFKSMIDREFES